MEARLPGTITLIGSGETASTGGQVFEGLASKMAEPLHISILETPAGFEANASRVAGRVADYLAIRLSNHHPQISQVAARKKGTLFSPNSPDVVRPLYDSNLIFFGPGSPTYAVRQLRDSLAWHVLQARHRLGASLVLASAAIIAIGTLALPVYEIFKVGEDPHWKPGLDIFAPYGLALVMIPHWNNHEGGEELDTSRCFIGLERFQQLLNLLPAGMMVVGVDEHTAITIDFQARTCQVTGRGSVHLLRGANQTDCPAGCTFPIEDLGDFRSLPSPEAGLPLDVWQQALDTARQASQVNATTPAEFPPEVQELVTAREEARSRRDWPRADWLRQQISSLGWQVSDSPKGTSLAPLDPSAGNS